MLSRVEGRETGQPCRIMAHPTNIWKSCLRLHDDHRHADALTAVRRVRGRIALSIVLLHFRIARIVMGMGVMSAVMPRVRILHSCHAMLRSMGVRG